MTCFACGSEAVSNGVCLSCELPQAESVRDLHQQSHAEAQRAKVFRDLVGIVAVLALVAGAVVGYFARGLQPGSEPASQPAVAVADSGEPRQVPLRHVNAEFTAQMDSALHLGVVSWYVHEEGTLIMELRPPASDRPALWETLTDDERREIMEFIGVMYTVIRGQAGYLEELAGGHPAVALKYRGHSTPLALRNAEGEVTVFPSSYQESP